MTKKDLRNKRLAIVLVGLVGLLVGIHFGTYLGMSIKAKAPVKCAALHVLGKQGHTSLLWDYDTKPVDGAVWLWIKNPIEIECLDTLPATKPTPMPVPSEGGPVAER